jgi:LysR family transcriptional regulator, transcriptional activator of the cysJI operon
MYLGARLRAFAGFVRRGSFSAAAEELRISQPAVSKHIADLERDLGVQLIDRRSRAMTVAGDYLAAHVLRAEALLRQAAQGLVALREPMSGTLSIVASGTPGTYVLPEIVAAFQREHAGVRVHFELSTSAEVIKAVRAHRAEIGIAGGFVAAPEISAEPLIEDEIVIVGSSDFARRRLSRDDLEALTWISREEGSATRLIADDALADLGIVPRHRLALPAWEAIKIAVRRGHGIAAFSRLAVTEELAAGELVIIPFVPWKVRRIFSIVRIRDATLTAPAEQFVDLLRTFRPSPFSADAANRPRVRSSKPVRRRSSRA